MSSRVDSAIPTRLSSIQNEHIGKKLRVVGKYVPIQACIPLLVVLELTSLYSRVLSHDVKSSIILLWNDCHIILADISLCLPTRGSASWLREPGSTITLFGYLEQTEVTFYTAKCDLPRDLPSGTGCQAGRNAIARPPASAAAP